jgi:hypothetical protein
MFRRPWERDRVARIGEARDIGERALEAEAETETETETRMRHSGDHSMPPRTAINAGPFAAHHDLTN